MYFLQNILIGTCPISPTSGKYDLNYPAYFGFRVFAMPSISLDPGGVKLIRSAQLNFTGMH